MPTTPARSSGRRRPCSDGRDRSHAAGRNLTIGFMPGILPTATVRALRERFPDLHVDVVRTSWDDQVEMVLDGRIDAASCVSPSTAAGSP